ncbi:MAG: tRNA-queuosine alpha-mannosyltransferase domain-containing protein [Candidatus Promineifilaceae bacterium]
MSKRQPSVKILLISPYHSGSHQRWAEGYARHSTHEVQLLTLPGQYWKWRMVGGAVTLARMFRALREDQMTFDPDLIIVDDMLDLTTFLALTRAETQGIPIALYMHENQLTYPLHQDKTQGAMRRQKGKRDRKLVFVNYASMLAADQILFNSTYHLESWFGALPNFLKNYPDYNELGNIEALRAKSSVLYVGVDEPTLQPNLHKDERLPLILWNQRWEYDKNPEQFLRVLLAVDAQAVPFRVAFCGENFSQNPTAFEQAIAQLGEKVVHVGHASAEKYSELLQQTTVTFSTALHEFFGISMVEAMLAGAFVLLPRRLSYPELIPESLASAVFYEDEQALIRKLAEALREPAQTLAMGAQLGNAARRFGWGRLSAEYDAKFNQIM